MTDNRRRLRLLVSDGPLLALEHHLHVDVAELPRNVPEMGPFIEHQGDEDDRCEQRKLCVRCRLQATPSSAPSQWRARYEEHRSVGDTKRSSGYADWPLNLAPK